ncbi:MAG TPA: HAD family hydrolase [Acidilobales archaeon]|nr:HAD family hydrolase [Acidilobales archaeon]
MRVVAFDFDGVLVNSYDCLRRVYDELALLMGMSDRELFVELMLAFEDVMDYLGIWDRFSWFNLIHKSPLITQKLNVDYLVSTYWRLRTSYSKVINDALHVLKKLKELGIPMYIVCGADGVPGLKEFRVSSSGLDKLVTDVITYGEGGRVKTLNDALSILKERHINEVIYYVDDKPKNLNELNIDGVIPVLLRIKPPLPRGFSWLVQLKKDVRVIDKLSDLLYLIRS